MRIIKYLLRGIEEVVRDLNVVKSVVIPRRRSAPSKMDGIASHIALEFSLKGFHVLDEKGTILTSTDPERGKEIYLRFEPSMEDANYLSLKERDWITIYKRKGFVYVVVSSYQLDIVDMWVISRMFERLLWGRSWGG